MGDEEPAWQWNQSLAVRRRTPFYSRFIRGTSWSYLVLLILPIAWAVGMGMWRFPSFVVPAMLGLVWMELLAVIAGVVIAPVAGLVIATAVTVVTKIRQRRHPGT